MNITGITDQSLNCDNDGFFSTTGIEGSYIASAQADHAGLNPSEEFSFQMPPSVVDHVFTLGHASIDINPSDLTFSLDHGETSSQLIRIENQGTSPLNYTVKGDFSIASLNHLSASTLGKAHHVKAYPSRQSQSFNKGDISQKRKLRPKRSLSSTSYQGDFIRFSISEVGTLDSFEYPIGSNHFYPFFPFTGFALHYRLSGTEISLINDGFLWGFNPPHASVLVNDEHKLEISYEFSSTDGSVAVLRRFHFDKHSSSLRIEDRIENRSSSSLEDLVFKRFVDTAINGIPESEHRGFEQKNILYGKRESCFGFGTDGKALLRDINGWNDFHSKETYVDDPDGPLSMDAILIYHYEEQLLAPSGSFDVVTTLAGAEDKDELEEALDGQNPWLKLSQQKGTIAPGAHQDLIVEANTDKLSAGSYSTEINVSHNVLHLNELTIPVQLTVTGAPSFTLPTASLDFGKVFIGELHSQALTIGNEGSADLELHMDWDSERFSCSHSNINIAAGSEEVLILSYSPKTTHLDSATINFSSNDPQNPSASISLTGQGIGAPIAQLSPLLIEKNLTIGQKSEPLSLSLHNLGHSRLDFRLKDIVQKENDDVFRTNTSPPLKEQAQANLKPHPNKLSKKKKLEAAHHPQQWIVSFRNGQRELKPETLKTCGVFEQRTLAPSPEQKKGSRQLALVHCNHLMNESSCWKALETDPGVEWAEPNYIYKLLAQPNDPHFPLLWGMEDSSGGDIDAPEAWAIETGNPNVVVAVLDTGIDEQHEDLQQNLWVNPGEIEGDFIDNDGNGYIDDVHGWNFFDNSSSLFDDHGHGTHVSGTIAAVGNNGIGVAGVCWEARIATIKIFNAMGFTNSAAIIEAIAYLKRMDFRISNNSWGGGAFSQGIRDAIAALDDHLFVAAAGNDGLNNDIHPFYPSSYDLEQVISVASTSPNDVLSDFSNFGQNTVDLSAPGAAIFSCYPGGDYGYMSGTSMASPHVAGACALLLSHKQLKAPVLKKTLLESCDLISSLSDFVPEGRRLNLHRALTESPSSLISLSPSSGNVEAGSLSQLTLELNSEGQSIGDLHYLIQIETNDPQQATLTANLILHIQGISIISASTHQLDMGSLEVGKVSLHHLTLTNTGSANLNISELDWGSPHLQIANFPSVIGPQHSETLEITYIPIESETWSDTLKIKSDASNHPILEIGMNGFSYNNSHSVDFGNTVLNQSKSLLLDITNPKPFPINPTFHAGHPMLGTTLSPSVIPPFSSAILELSFTPHHLGLQQGALQLLDESCEFSCEIIWKGDCSEGNLFSISPLHLEHRSLSHEDLLLKLRLEHLSSANNAITAEISPNLGALAVTTPSSVISGKGAIDLLISNTATLNHGLLSGNIIITVAEHSLKDQKLVPINIEVLPNPMFDRDQLFWPSQLPFQVNEGEAQILQLSREGPWLPELNLELTPHYQRSGFHQWVDIPTHVHFEAGQQNSRPLIIDFAENQIFHDNVIVTLASAPLDDLTLAPHETLDIELIENDTFVFSTQWTNLNLSKGSEVELRGRFNVGPWKPTPSSGSTSVAVRLVFMGKQTLTA